MKSLNYLGWTFELVARNLKHNKTGINEFVLLTKPTLKGISIRRVDELS
jgi:hypothetical protein